MKKCLSCNTLYAQADWTCPNCNATPRFSKGFPLFAEHLLEGSDSFAAKDHDLLDQAEDSFFWFRSRKELLGDLFLRYCRNVKHFLEIGCGNGTVLAHFQSLRPDIRYFGSEIYLTALENSLRRVQNAVFFQMDIGRIPFESEFDAIGAFDVLEHIDDDVAALEQLHNALTPTGYLLLTAPQHMFLWSQNDVVACHKRRYGFSDLKEKLARTGFKVAYRNSFIFFLLPSLVVARFLAGKSNESAFRMRAGLNEMFYRICALERRCIQAGMRFPAGNSLVVIARKA